MQREEKPVMATGLERIAAKARSEPKLRFTSLAHHITGERVWESLQRIPNNSAPGVDGQTVAEAKDDFAAWIEPMLEAMHRQAATLNVHSRYLHEGVLDYAERLTGLHAEPLSSVVFTCSGTEASEVALLMARAATGGRGIIGTDAGYHGNSAEVRKLTAAGPVNPEFRAIPFPQRYRPLLHRQ